MTAAPDRPTRSSSRIRAPQVAPVVHQGVRFEALGAASVQGLPPGLYVAATEVASGKRLWTAKLLETVYDPRRETDVQNVFMRSLTLDPAGTALVAEDERGRRWRVELATGAVSAVAKQ